MTIPFRFEPSESAAFAALLQGGGRLLGLDPGTKTIGLSICDDGWSVASPVGTVTRTTFTKDVEGLLAYTAREGVAGLVLGLPLNMDDSEGPRAQSSRAFARNLARHSVLPVLFWDERLSSEAAYEAVREGKRQKRKTGAVDAIAATIILRSCLDVLRPDARTSRHRASEGLPDGETP